MTVPGAAGGVKYIPKMAEQEVRLDHSGIYS